MFGNLTGNFISSLAVNKNPLAKPEGGTLAGADKRPNRHLPTPLDSMPLALHGEVACMTRAATTVISSTCFRLSPVPRRRRRTTGNRDSSGLSGDETSSKIPLLLYAKQNSIVTIFNFMVRAKYTHHIHTRVSHASWAVKIVYEIALERGVAMALGAE